ncbi:MAG: aldehyde dehydrogenase family protein [Synergistaceae bacterium]|jgi:acyl-CoA reductase-like NAD-dependent aldehyde dehydrogenase|nr:aldehyde dehydrogenase family protein [Synergistaceae bacterium]
MAKLDFSFENAKKLMDGYYPLYIDGKWMDGSDKEVMDVYCPANQEKISSVACASEKDVDTAVKAAWRAFPAWSKISLTERYNILQQMYARLTARATELGMVESLETGKNMAGNVGEIYFAIDQFPYFASAMRVAEDGISSAADGSKTMAVREPVGVVGAICPWNAPIIMCAWKLAPALAAGNCVVMKPSSFTPAGTMELLKLVADLLPPGVFNVINGKGSKTGQFLMDHPGISKLSFTGSTEIGVQVGLAAAKRLIPATLELGGKSAGIYFADIVPDLLDEALGYAAVMLFMSGQGCALQTRCIVQESIYDMFVDRLAEVFRNYKVGMPWDTSARMGSIAYEAHMNSVLDYIDIGKKEGARLVCGGSRITSGEMGKGFFIEPTLFADVDNGMRIAQEEIFGPVLCVIKFKDEEDAIRIANDSVYGLGGGVMSGDLAKALRVAGAMRTGTVTINNAATHLAGAPFGGFKQSGLGRESYRTTLDHFSEIKTINFKY